ncbi:MAG TPA: hypothetical protein VMB21_04690, partial [Candidatus Limnocylindria bacterium]|nr:hypothetical protein [Candidatus Limnocylindria bacterium]
TVALNPRIVTNDGKFGLLGGQFGFTLSGRAATSVVVEACDNPAAPSWVPVSTNLFNAQGSAQFSDPKPANQNGRFYRFRTQ